MGRGKQLPYKPCRKAALSQLDCPYSVKFFIVRILTTGAAKNSSSACGLFSSPLRRRRELQGLKPT